jgi:hypothetical protein
MARQRVRRIARFAVTAALVGGALQSAASTAEARSGRAWEVSPLGSGYEVTLRLDHPLPGRDAVPELAADGKSIGPATESADGRTLTVITTDSRVARASSVRLAWNGRVEGKAPTRSSGRQAPTPLAAATSTPDPTGKGPYGVQRADYNFGDSALTLPGLDNKAVEERAAVWVPAGAPGRRPVVVLLHGRHDSCFEPGTGNSTDDVWPCPSGRQAIASYLGFNASAQDLASDGYVVVSISANGVNALDNVESEDRGALARGQLILDHLDLLAAADAGTAPGMSALLKGRLDLSSVGLMGHSRGGEGTAKAVALNAARPHPYGIKGLLMLAPVDYARETVPGIPMATVIGYCDGDVSDLRGQHYYDDARYADPTDHAMRASILVMGANHNFFNTEWTPGLTAAPAFDDWDAEVDATDPTCGSAQPTNIRLTADQQNQVGTAYITGFFRTVMGGESKFLPMFDNAGSDSVSVGAATVFQQSQSPVRLDVAPLQAQSADVTVPSGAEYCAGMDDLSPQSGLPSCTLSPDTARFPAFTPQLFTRNVTSAPMLHLTRPGTVTVNLKSHDVSAYDALTVRAAPDDMNVASSVSATLVDGAGKRQSVTLPALSAFPGSGTVLPKTWQRTLRQPLAALSGVNTHDIRQVVLSTSGGGVLLSDLAFRTAAVGGGEPSKLPQASLSGTTVKEGNGPGQASVVLHLSKASTVPVTVEVQTIGDTGTQIAGAAQRIVITPGQTSVPVRIPLVGDTVREPTPDTTYPIVVSAVTNAVVSQAFAHVVVRDDDPVS